MKYYVEIVSKCDTTDGCTPYYYTEYVDKKLLTKQQMEERKEIAIKKFSESEYCKDLISKIKDALKRESDNFDDYLDMHDILLLFRNNEEIKETLKSGLNMLKNPTFEIATAEYNGYPWWNNHCRSPHYFEEFEM